MKTRIGILSTMKMNEIEYTVDHPEPASGILETSRSGWAPQLQPSGRCLCAELQSLTDSLSGMIDQESGAYRPCEDYFSQVMASSMAGPDLICEAWRRKLCEWCYAIVDHYNLDRDVVFYAINYLDRTVAEKLKCSCAVTSQQYQLYTLSSLYLAFKLHGGVNSGTGQRVIPHINDFVGWSQGVFMEDLIWETEWDILKSLSWRVSPPTVTCYISTLLRICLISTIQKNILLSAQVINEILDTSRYVAELAVCISSLAFQYKTSTTAYACVLYALNVLPINMSLPKHVLDVFTNSLRESAGFQPDDPQVKKVYTLLQELHTSVTSAILRGKTKQLKTGASVYAIDDNETAAHSSTRDNSEPSPKRIRSQKLSVKAK